MDRCLDAVVSRKRVLIFGASGMLGSAVFRLFGQDENYDVFGTVRSADFFKFFPDAIRDRVMADVNANDYDDLVRAFEVSKPVLVLNCIGLVKQLPSAMNPLSAIPINSLLPHRLARLAELSGARLVHFSTDCVFAGSKGNYVESDPVDARDVYGLSKYFGEVDYENAITLRTSIIGHELQGSRSLIGWFLSQTGVVKGYRRAVFSGLPTVEVARVVRDYVVPNPRLRGLYHLSTTPINKMDLLGLVAKEYKKSIEIRPSDDVVIDRSLDSTRFQNATNYRPKSWHELIREMREFG